MSTSAVKSTHKILPLLGVAVLVLIVTGAAVFFARRNSLYNPAIRPSDFTTTITNKYFSVKPGMKLVYKAETAKGTETDTITIENATKVIDGFTAVVYRDQIFLNDQPVEDTTDYLAQQKGTGDVWYFGEAVNNYQNGSLKDHKGSFMHGTDGAKAGIWMKENPKVGDSYRQEYYKGHAEDMLDVKAVNQTVKTKQATYTGCVKLYAWTPIEDDKEYKYNCPSVSAEVMTQDLTENKQIELVSITQ